MPLYKIGNLMLNGHIMKRTAIKAPAVSARPLGELALGRGGEGASERRSRAYKVIREDSSTETTHSFSTKVELCKRSTEEIPLKEFFKLYGEKLQLQLLTSEKGLERTIGEKSINRPALALTGYLKHFASKRLQLLGAGEMSYLKDLSTKKQIAVLEQIAKRKVPCIIISRNLQPTESLQQVCQKYTIALFRTALSSKDFSAQATVLLEDMMAPRATIHGTLMDIRGIGTLLRGKSGIGKSECALALIEKGHSFVSDDAIHLKLISENELLGSASPLNYGFMECRGIGIINVAEMFGIRSVRFEKRIDLVITFIEWEEGAPEERTGLDDRFFQILGYNVPHVEIYVRPGRDMARIVEVATMGHALKKMGYNAPEKFNQQLLNHLTSKQ